MRVGLHGMAAKLPNLALMRLSEYHKAHGDEVILNPVPTDAIDRLYISTLFTWLAPEVEKVAAHFRSHADVQIGGPGVLPQATALPDEIDVWPNDYSLYPKMDYGLGYSTRGCIRNCAFCPVPKIEGKMRENVPIRELIHPNGSLNLALLDNNFFAAPSWPDKIKEIRRRGLVVDWPQGNDVRLLTEEMARALGELRAHGQIGSAPAFTTLGHLNFAWDLPATDVSRAEVLRGIDLLMKAGFPPHDLRFFMLIGYPKYLPEEELERIRTLHDIGIEPYVMVYRDYSVKDKRDPVRGMMRDWNNGHAWRNVAFNEWSRAKTKGRLPQGMERLFAD